MAGRNLRDIHRVQFAIYCKLSSFAFFMFGVVEFEVGGPNPGGLDHRGWVSLINTYSV